MCLALLAGSIAFAQDATPQPATELSIDLPILNDLPPAEPDLSTYPVTVENCGRELIFDVQAEAEELVADMQARLDAVQTAIGDADPVTAMIYYGGEGPLNVFTNGVYGSIIELAGGQTVFPDAERTVEEVSPEVVASLVPEAYLIIPWTDTFENLRVFLYATFPDAPATVNDRAVLMPDGTTPAGYRTVEAIEQLAQVLHPEAFE